MSKRKKKPTECIMPQCANKPARRELCWTHYEHLTEFASIEVQRVVEEREREREKAMAAKLDWDYLTEDQRSAIERGVRDAYWENSDLQIYDLENMLQEAWIRAASHKAEVQKIKTFTLLRLQAKRWAIEANKTAWNNERQMDYFEDLLSRDEEG